MVKGIFYYIYGGKQASIFPVVRAVLTTQLARLTILLPTVG